MQEFHVVAGSSADAPAGSSVGASEDGSASAVILGDGGATARAGALADAFVGADRRIVPCQETGLDYLVHDHRDGCVAVVTAPVGLRQIYWTLRDGRLHLASSPSAFARTPSAGGEINLQALFDYVYFHCLPSPISFFAGISKLEAGHVLHWDGKRCESVRYWRPEFLESPPSSERAAATELRDLLEAAIRRNIGGTASFGAFLSGGLDSSTVAGLAARLAPGVPTVSMGFDVRGYDEMEYARIASRRFGTKPLEYYVTPDDLLGTLPDIAAAFPEPFGNSSAAAAFHCARIAREHGLELLLAGDGGDELFGGNERYARQLVFERYGRIPSALRHGLLEPAIAAASRLTDRFPVNKARSYVEQAKVPLPDRLQSYNFLHRHDPSEVFPDEVLDAVDRSLPLRQLREEYATPSTTSPINRMLFMDWKFTLHDNDLVKVGTMCRFAGVRVAYPMLDQPLVDFSLRIPGDWKVRNGDLRWFYKRAMEGFLPPEILRKTKHGFGLPFGVWTRTHDGLRRLSADALDSLARRRFFRPEFIREALRLHGEGHAAYYGELVWILMVLELWLQRHMPRASL